MKPTDILRIFLWGLLAINAIVAVLSYAMEFYYPTLLLVIGILSAIIGGVILFLLLLFLLVCLGNFMLTGKFHFPEPY